MLVGMVNYWVDDEHEWTQNTALWNPAGDATISRMCVTPVRAPGKIHIKICLLSNFLTTLTAIPWTP